MSGVKEIRALRRAAATALVEAVIADAAASKVVLLEFDRRRGGEPDEAAACVVRAYDEGRVDDWLAVALLGRVGHPAGLATVLAIVRADRDPRAGGFVRAAVVGMGGGDAYDALVATLREHPSLDARNVAARTLGALGARAAIAEAAAAARDGRIGIRSARVALAGMDPDATTVTAWLRSGEASEVTLGCEVVFELLARGQKPEAALAPWVAAAVGALGESMLRYKREALRAWAERAVAEGAVAERG